MDYYKEIEKLIQQVERINDWLNAFPILTSFEPSTVSPAVAHTKKDDEKVNVENDANASKKTASSNAPSSKSVHPDDTDVTKVKVEEDLDAPIRITTNYVLSPQYVRPPVKRKAKQPIDEPAAAKKGKRKLEMASHESNESKKKSRKN